jgi:O-antigen ligase
MKGKVQPFLLSILVSLLLLVSLVKDTSFSDPVYVSKQFYFLFLILPLLIVYIRNQFKVSLRTVLYGTNYLDLAVLVFFIYSFFRSLFTPELIFPHPDVIVQFFLVVLYLIVKTSINAFTEKEHGKFIGSLTLGLLLILLINSLYGLFQLTGLAEPAHELFKIGGSFGNPGPFAIFLITIVPAAFSVLFFSNQFSKKTYRLAVSGISLIVLLLPFTMSRTAWIGFILVLGYFFWLKIRLRAWYRKFIQNKFMVFSGIAVTVVVLFVIAVFLWELKENSASGRLFIWQITAQMVSDAPLFGHGYDSFAHSLNDYQAAFFQNPDNLNSAAAQTADNATFAFNEFFQVAAETGLLGLVLLGVIIFFAFYKSHPDQTENKVLRVFAQGIIVAILVCSLFSYPLYVLPIKILFYLALGVISGVKLHSIKEISVKRTIHRMNLTILIAFCALFYAFSLQRLSAEKEWHKFEQSARNMPPEILYKKYNELMPVMSYNKYFMFNFGTELIVAGNYEKGIRVLNETLPRLNDSNIYIYLGKAYFETGQYQKAENCFEHAYNIVPTKIFPLYNLVKVYQKTNRPQKALNLAGTIIEMGEKVKTDIGNGILLEMRKYVEEGNN